MDYLRLEELIIPKQSLKEVIPLITCSMGYGKTYTAINDLKKWYEKIEKIKIDMVIHLTPTASIKNQTIKDYANAEEFTAIDFIERGFKTRVQHFGTMKDYIKYDDGSKRILVVVDEIDQIVQ